MKQLGIFILIFITYGLTYRQSQANWINIPAQTLNLNHLIGDTASNEHTIQEFELSKLITLKEYKVYLQAVKKDSGINYYRTQLPDTNISSKERWQEYISKSKYEAFPVVGISWDNAMNYCKWLTLKQNPDSIQFIYRLPACSEWLAAYSYLNKNNIPNDLNQQYSDWLLGEKIENIKAFKSAKKEQWYLDFLYFPQPTDPPAMKRKIVIGNSFLYQQPRLLTYQYSYYAYQGYRQIGFRLVKDTHLSPIPVQANTMENGKLYQRSNSQNINTSILKHWGIIPNDK